MNNNNQTCLLVLAAVVIKSYGFIKHKKIISTNILQQPLLMDLVTSGTINTVSVCVVCSILLIMRSDKICVKGNH